MGFITPGINYVYNRKRVGRNNKSMNIFVHPNENRDFNERYPNNLQYRKIHDARKMCRKIFEFIQLVGTGRSELVNPLRYKIERYIILVNDVENSANLKDIFPIRKDDAIRLLKNLIKYQGKSLLEKIQECMDTFETPPLEAVLSPQMELMEGGCILLNKYLNRELTISIKKPYKHRKYLPIESAAGEGKKPFVIKLEDEQSESILNTPIQQKKITNITELPDEILVKILSQSHNIDNITLTCKFFYDFVLTHMKFISYEFIVTKFVHRYKLRKDKYIQADDLTDEHYHLNSHSLKVSELELVNTEGDGNVEMEFHEDVSGNYSLTRYRDPDILTVLSSHAFETTYMTYSIYKLLNVDHIIPPEAWPEFKEKYDAEYSKLEEFGAASKIEKSEFVEFWKKHPVDVPYLDLENPRNIDNVKAESYMDKLRIVLDLMVLKTIFTCTLENLFYFITSLVINIEDGSKSSIPIKLLKNYALFYLRNNNENENEEGELDDDQLWRTLKFKNPSFYILLKRSSSEEFEELLCPLFYGEHIQDNMGFWMGLKSQNEVELIEELINEKNISPSTYILNRLAF